MGRYEELTGNFSLLKHPSKIKWMLKYKVRSIEI